MYNIHPNRNNLWLPPVEPLAHPGGCPQQQPAQTGSSRSHSGSSHPLPFQMENQWKGRCSWTQEWADPRGRHEKCFVCTSTACHTLIPQSLYMYVYVCVMRPTRCCSSVVWETELPLTMTFDPASGVIVTRRCSFLNAAWCSWMLTHKRTIRNCVFSKFPDKPTLIYYTNDYLHQFILCQVYMYWVYTLDSVSNLTILCTGFVMFYCHLMWSSYKVTLP